MLETVALGNGMECIERAFASDGSLTKAERNKTG